MLMTKTTLTIGLNDKDCEKQLISSETAKSIIGNTLICKFGIYAYTLTECFGVYRMVSTGNIVHEKSLKVEIASEEAIPALDSIVSTLKTMLNQESIMIEQEVKEIRFE